MARKGNMLGVGGTRNKLSRGALRGNGRGPGFSGQDPQTQKRELLRKLQEQRGEGRQTGEAESAPETETEGEVDGPGPGTGDGGAG
ncbi:DUF6243 family protein [Streptomyces physcomitrii]